MILLAMMFALGVLVSGLAWLVFCVALVRRTRSLTERRLLASISSSRTEFVTERDELRARHAVDMHRLEREVSRGLDTATAYRLEADVKEIDLSNLRAELAAREDDFQELQGRLAAERQAHQDLERRTAETGATLRAVQHALKLESARRAAAEDLLDDAGVLTEQRRSALASLQSENDELRSALTPANEGGKLPRILLPSTPPTPAQIVARDAERGEAAPGASVVQLPVRGKSGAQETPDQSAALVAEAARDLQRLAGEAHGDMAKGVWRAPAHPDARLPVATAPGEATVADLLAHRMAAVPAQGLPPKDVGAEPDLKAESRFFQALAEIRALKRSASQAGE